MDDQTNQPGADAPTQAPGGWTPPVQQDPQVPAEPVVNPVPEPVVPPAPAGGPEPVVTPTEEPMPAPPVVETPTGEPTGGTGEPAM